MKTMIESFSNSVDARIRQLVAAIDFKGYSRTGIDLVAEAIDAYRAEVAKELKGLESDARTAESAYEREKARADGLAQENDRWMNESLPGWRKRVTDAERARNVADAYISRVEAERDDWKADAATSELKLEKAIEERDAYKQQRDGAEIALSKIAALAAHPDDVVDASFNEFDAYMDGERVKSISGCLCTTCQNLTRETKSETIKKDGITLKLEPGAAVTVVWQSNGSVSFVASNAQAICYAASYRRHGCA